MGKCSFINRELIAEQILQVNNLNESLVHYAHLQAPNSWVGYGQLSMNRNVKQAEKVVGTFLSIQQQTSTQNIMHSWCNITPN